MCYTHVVMRICISLVIIASFVLNMVPLRIADAGMSTPLFPEYLASTSPSFTPAVLKGIVVHPDNPLKLDFLILRSHILASTAQKSEEYHQLVKYFLTALTIPDNNQWVNLSPYEHDRIIEADFGKTEMGRTLLEQDYLLKQLTASLMYPDSPLGRFFWDKVYEKAYEKYGTSDIPVDTFNKVWIVPDTALVYENGNGAYVAESHLKVMLERDYLAGKVNAVAGESDFSKEVVRLLAAVGMTPFSAEVAPC